MPADTALCIKCGQPYWEHVDNEREHEGSLPRVPCLLLKRHFMEDKPPQPPSTPQPEHRALRYFAHAHLPKKLQAVSREFEQLAWGLSDSLPEGPEKDKAMDRLLEAKDAAVRAALGG